MTTHEFESGDLRGKTDTVYLGQKRFYTGPDYTNPALKGAAGFNEAYYLNSYADASQAVKSGRFNSGLEHFLKVGRDEGYLGFAANTIVYGSKKGDVITLREGDEKAFGLGAMTRSSAATATTG